MRGLARIILAGLIIATLAWLRAQISKLHRSLLNIDRLAQDGMLFSNQLDADYTNESNSTTEDPFRAVMHAISDSLLSKSIDDLVTSKSALRDTRDKVVVVASTAEDKTKWVTNLLPKQVCSYERGLKENVLTT
jgi:hypothetical protein